MKKLYKILLSSLIMVLLAAAIFFFSEQSGADSHSLSSSVATMVAARWAKLFGGKSKFYDVDLLAKMLDGPIRKLAHLTIYMFLGLGASISFHFINDWKIKFRHVFICVLIVFLVACLDEANQFYSGGRGASFGDVIIDTVGGCIGIYIVFIIRDFFRHIRNGINRH